VLGHIEPLAAVLRVGGAYGEPWTWAATLRYLSPTEVEVLAAERAPTLSEWRAMRAVTIEAGIRTAHLARCRNGTLARHTWTERGKRYGDTNSRSEDERGGKTGA
jgi:hypothetical protein